MGMFGGNDQDRSGRTPPPSENPFLKNVGARDPLTPPQRPAPQAARRSQEAGLKGFVKKLFGGKEPDLEELGRRAGAQARAAQSKAEEFLARDDVQEGLKTARTEAAKAAQSGLKAAESGASYLARKNAETGFLGKVWAAVSPHKIPLALFVLGCFLIYGYQVQVTYGRDALGYPMRSSTGPVVDGQIALGLLSGLGGFLLGFLPILIFSKYRGYAFAALGLLLFAFLTTPSIGTLAYLPLGAMGLFGGLFLGAMLFFKPQDLSTDAYGSARLARRADIEAAGLTEARGYRLGLFEDAAGADLLHYAGQRHLLTCAPTRAGKGVSSIIPNLLTYEGSILVIDPKGENLMITAEQRHRLGHDVQALDPWNIGASFFEGAEPSRFNPLDFVDADSPDLVENAMILADALVPVGRGDTSFWDEEAKALLMGLILHVATDEAEQAQRHLPRVRDLLLGDDKDMNDLFEHMMKSEHPAVRGAGARTLQKETKMRSSVLATAQAHTHFLDSPRIRESLSASDFRFADMKGVEWG